MDSIDHYAETIRQQAKEIATLTGLLCDLADAADAFAADQDYATDQRCGLVQPVTVEECEALAAALRAAWQVLDETTAAEAAGGE